MFNQILSSILGKQPSISPNQLKERLNNKDFILLDVRTPEEFSSGHIPEAINVPVDSITDYSGDKTKEHILICASGMRSLQASTILTKQGYQTVNVSPGMNAWTGTVKGGN